MLLSLLVHLNSLRYWLPAAAMLGMAPAFVLCRVAGLLLLPRRVRRRMDDRMYALYQHVVLCFFENFTAVEVIIYGDIPAQKENVIYISNHQSTVDWVVADMVAVRQGALGDMRYILKDGLKWLPLYGWYFSQHGGTYVKRSLKFDEKMLLRKLDEYVKMDSPIFLVIFPEGTRYNPELPQAIEASQSFAGKEGLDVLNHVLTPRVKATQAALAALRGHVRAIYDVTVAYEGSVDTQGKRKAAPTMPEFLCGACPRVHIHFERLDLDDIPDEGFKLKLWLHNRFQKKDRLMAAFYGDGLGELAFPAKGKTSSVGLHANLSSLLISGGLSLPLLLTSTGRRVYCGTWLYGTLLGWLWVLVRP
uniref:1-acyl-sn-glycerol-3-phosphate acyltransferase epsilon-like isoform X1 n=1 Tax=Myxine glutinosa TaxID=7769 RepID=UPI00358E3132